MKTAFGVGLVYVAIVVTLLVGEVKCIIKAINCNWEPIGKAEVIYTGASLTGLGCVVGFINLEDKSTIFNFSAFSTVTAIRDGSKL